MESISGEWISLDHHPSVRCYGPCSPRLRFSPLSPAGLRRSSCAITVTAIYPELWPATTPAVPTPALNISPVGLLPSVPNHPQKAIPTAPSALFSKSIWVWGVTITVRRGGHRDVGGEWWAQVASGVPCSEIFQEAPMWGKRRI